MKGSSAELGDTDGPPFPARRIPGRPALCLPGPLLLRYAPADVADAFCASCLGGDAGGAPGTLPAGTAVDGIVGRAAVGVS